MKEKDFFKNNEILFGEIISHEEDTDIMGMPCKDLYTIRLENGQEIKIDDYAGVFDKYKIVEKECEVNK